MSEMTLKSASSTGGGGHAIETVEQKQETGVQEDGVIKK